MVERRLLYVWLDLPIQPTEMDALRGAIIQLMGPDAVLFHHHQGSSYLQRYPLIQYKWVRRPLLLGIHDGVPALVQLFNRLPDTLSINGRQVPVRVARVRPKAWQWQVTDRRFAYRLIRWLPLNDHNYQQYQRLTSEAEIQAFLTRILIGNILSMAKGLNWFVDQPIQVINLRVQDTYRLLYKPHLVRTAMNITFQTNVHLPYYIGLGKGSSKGYGILLPCRHKQALSAN